MFTVNTIIGTITSSAPFKGYEYMTGKFPGVGGIFSGMLKLSTMAKIVGWNAQDMADGMNYLYEKAQAGKVFYDIYSEENRQSEPGKRLTGIAAFPLKEKKPFVLICAGGGYSSVCSMVEAYPIIRKINEAGFAAFSMQYRCGKNAAAPNPMDDLAQALRFILNNADELNIVPEGFAIMGFSAGGHLAACFGLESIGYANYGLPKPAALMLCYPVITMGDMTHKGSRKNLLGKAADDKSLRSQYSVEQGVTAGYPASYVWQFEDDSMVPVDNSRMIVEALRKNGIAYEYETFPGTLHGAGLGTGTSADGWLDRSLAFWKKQRENK